MLCLTIISSHRLYQASVAKVRLNKIQQNGLNVGQNVNIHANHHPLEACMRLQFPLQLEGKFHYMILL